MGFGLSGDNDRTKMVGGDVTIAWMDHQSGTVITLNISTNILPLMLYILHLIYPHRSGLC